MKNLQLKPLAMWGGDGEGRGGSKKSKSITVPPRGVGLKSCPIPAPPYIMGKTFSPYPPPVRPRKAPPNHVKLYILLICPTTSAIFLMKTISLIKYT